MLSLYKDNLVESVVSASQPLVLFRAGGMVMAAPLAQTVRIGEIDYRASAQHVSYQGGDMPVHRLCNIASGQRPVLVFGRPGALQALVVDEVLDIIAFEGDLPPTLEAVAGIAHIRGRTTEIINLDWFLHQDHVAA